MRKGKNILLIGILSLSVAVGTGPAIEAKNVKKDPGITKTVITQSQLDSALKNNKVKSIILKSKKNEKITVKKGTYKKTLKIIQDKATINNDGDFSEVIVVAEDQAQFDKAIKIKDVDQVLVSTKKKVNLSMKSDNVNRDLVINAPKATIANNGLWESISIVECKEYTENKGQNNIVAGGEGKIIIGETAADCKLTLGTKKLTKTLKVEINGELSQLIIGAPKGIEITTDMTEEKLAAIFDNSLEKKITFMFNGKEFEADENGDIYCDGELIGVNEALDGGEEAGENLKGNTADDEEDQGNASEDEGGTEANSDQENGI